MEETDYREAYEQEHLKCARLAERIADLEAQNKEYVRKLNRIKGNPLWKASLPVRACVHWAERNRERLKNCGGIRGVVLKVGYKERESRARRQFGRASFPDQEQADKKWENMADYLKTYMKGLQTPKSVEMLFLAAEEIGISDQGVFAVEDLLLESVGMEDGCKRSYYGSSSFAFSRIDLIRPFLSKEEHRKLFYIIERHIFVNYPDKYLSFLIGVLSKEDHLLWFPKEEAREVFLALTETVCQQKQLENLRKIYLTEEELGEFNLKRQET